MSTSDHQPSAAFSAGGVVYRQGDRGIEIVLCGRNANGLWALPKGTPEAGESATATALREVCEETGLRVVIERDIGSVRYRFTAPGGTEYDKTVDYHLMTPVGGGVDQHDAEYDEVRWVPVGDALAMMGHSNERDIVRKAVQLIKDMDRL